MYATRSTARPSSTVASERALRQLYRWALVLVAALAVMVALSRVAQGGEAAATVVVQPGDTLWTIAAERYPGDDPRARIDEIERLNNLVILVTRQGCHLCEDALRLLQELGIQPDLADVDADDELHRLYDFRVPVVLIDGAVVAEGRITREQLVMALGSKGTGKGAA